MHTSLFNFSKNQWITHPKSKMIDTKETQLLLCFAGKKNLEDENIYDTVSKKFPHAEIAMCSTAGEIYQEQVQDDSFVAVALTFEKTKIKTASINIKDYTNSYSAAINLAGMLNKKDLTYVMVFSDGSLVNGSELVKGLKTSFGKNVMVSGGLAGDGANFHSTLVGLNEQPHSGNIIAIGFYGSNIKIGHGSQGGWDMFGLEKIITKSESNVLSEIDNVNALDLYKKYLGPEAENLPKSALLFPLSLIVPGERKPIVRTILSIDEVNKTMTFAGDLPVGSKVKFMKSSFDQLTDAASSAAQQTLLQVSGEPCFALLISCVGRKLVLEANTKNEVEAVNKVLGEKTLMAGFYSYGEIAPFNNEVECQLHNQTMTITTFCES